MYLLLIVVQQVSLKLADGTMARFDGIGGLTEGTFKIIEAKMGNGKLSTNQQKLLGALKNGVPIYGTTGKSEAVFGAGTGNTDVPSMLNKNVNLNGTVQTIDNVIIQKGK